MEELCGLHTSLLMCKSHLRGNIKYINKFNVSTGPTLNSATLLQFFAYAAQFSLFRSCYDLFYHFVNISCQHGSIIYSINWAMTFVPVAMKECLRSTLGFVPVITFGKWALSQWKGLPCCSLLLISLTFHRMDTCKIINPVTHTACERWVC